MFEKGKLLYEGKIKKERKIVNSIKAGAVGIVFLSICFLMYLVFFKVIPIREEAEWAWFIPGIVVGPISFVLGIGFISIAIAGKKDLKIYDNGIELPDRSFIQILQKKENYICFKDIKSVYPNEILPYTYMVIKKRGGKKIPKLGILYKRDIDDIELFIRIIEKKVKVVKNICWKLGRGEVRI